MAATPEPCRVPWCASSAVNCKGEHWAGPGGEAWRGVIATGDTRFGAPQIAPAPAWSELEWCADLRPDEARQLAFELTRAAEAAEGVRVEA